MTSDPPDPDRVFVWVWLPERSDPVVAGVLQRGRAMVRGEPVLAFRYATSYLERPDRVSLFTPELPLTDRVHDPRRVPGREPLALAGCLRDSAPDAWGRRVINLEVAGSVDRELSETTYLLGSGSDRIGALDFQTSKTDYVARSSPAATLDELLAAADRVERGEPLPRELEHTLLHGTSIGGARPKALLQDGQRSLIAKFSSSGDHRPVVQAEAVAMLLAARAGLDVAPVSVVSVAGRAVLLVERFDRVPAADGTGTTRRQLVSMLTVLGASELTARHASYADLAHTIRTGPWQDVASSLEELFGRLVINVLVGNTDDHLRNHAAFWDGRTLQLSPAYDVAPQPRSTGPASHAIGITSRGERASQLRLCREVAPEFHLAPSQAEAIIDRVRTAVVDGFEDACDRARLTRAERRQLWGREFCNPYLDHAEA